MSTRPEARYLFKNMKKEKFEFIDIGSFHGVYAQLAIFSKNTKDILCIEANPNNENYLREIFSKHRYIKVINCIYSNKRSQSQFFIPLIEKNQYGIYSHGLGSAHGGRYEKEKKISLNSCSIAQLLNELKGKTSHLIIKVDIEGSEDEFVEDIISLKLPYDLVTLLIEITNRNSKEILNCLEKNGFVKVFAGDPYENTRDYILEKKYN